MKYKLEFGEEKYYTYPTLSHLLFSVKHWEVGRSVIIKNSRNEKYSIKRNGDWYHLTMPERTFSFNSFDTERMQKVLGNYPGWYCEPEGTNVVYDDNGNYITGEEDLTGYSDEIDWDEIKKYLDNDYEENN